MSEQRNIIIDNIDFSEALRYLGYGNSTPDEKTKRFCIIVQTSLSQ